MITLCSNFDVVEALWEYTMEAGIKIEKYTGLVIKKRTNF